VAEAEARGLRVPSGEPEAAAPSYDLVVEIVVAADRLDQIGELLGRVSRRGNSS